ncbi:hypothetical protein DYI37_04020 [Fulvimarina endophytica]|uniref:Putative exodeoxyribonuclease 8 PDDEXK-like domain-containing protein n=1 Tax=Fulvimarina endophytica TaxID=2293836 RepID=A0A371X775_9HYPH|nr:PD-(D/E)XK nuclease-like domain-containing protein [Fulvimarina endophytica]RFC65041.1 hypothetical protein DYI37_04020 [Fulvimarina endophytica]
MKITLFEPGVPITKPGLYPVPEATYHGDDLCHEPSLSSTLARIIIDESPLHAWHAHPRLNSDVEDEDESTGTMNVGSAMHAMLLGNGRGIAVCDFKNWQTKAAKEERDIAIESGLTPILIGQHRRAEVLVALARKQVAQYQDLPDLFGPGAILEHAAIWQENGRWCRALIDIIHPYPDFIAIVDYKSTERSAAPATVGRQVFDMGYDVQLAFYRRGIRRLFPNDRRPIRCFLMSQERGGPGCLSITELDEDVLTLGDKKVSAALALWDRCLTADLWPGYPPFPSTVTLPPYIESKWLQREINDDALAGAGYAFAVPLHDDEPRAIDPRYLEAG